MILCSLAEFRAIREKYDFFTLCQTPDLACEVTLMVSIQIVELVQYNTPVHLVESVENCGLCMRRYLVCSSYANVMHQELAITRALRYDTSARD